MKPPAVTQGKILPEDQAWFENCHASSLLKLGEGRFLCAYMAGTREGAPDMAIWLSRCENGLWLPPRRIHYAYLLPHWNPVLFQDGSAVHLYYKRGHTVHDWYTMHSVSQDGGVTWSEPAEAIEGDHRPRICVRCKIIRDSQGNWIGPASVESAAHWDSFVDISRDSGKTWTKHPIPFRHEAPPLPAPRPESLWEGLAAGALWEGRLDTLMRWDGVIQPTAWESEPGHLHVLMRGTRGFLYRSDSTDAGMTWCEAYPTSLPNNNSGIDVARTNSGILALAYNPVGQNWGKRTPLSLSFSKDNGETWTQPLALESQPGEYSYPAVIADGESLCFSYTHNRRNIVFGSCCFQA